MGYLSDPEYLKYKGFETADAAGPYFELMYLAFDRNADKPCFRHTAKNREDMPKGLVLYYTSQCPFTAKYVPLLEKQPKKEMWSFKPCIYRQERTPKTPRLPLQHSHCFAMENS